MGPALAQFEGHKPCQQRGWIKLTNNAFDVAETSRYRMHRNDVAVSCRRQGDEAQIENRVCKARIVLEGYSLESIGKQQANKYEQRPERDSDKQVQQDRAENSMLGDAATAKHSLSKYRSERDRNGEPSASQSIEIIWPWREIQTQHEDNDISDKADRHHGQGREVF